MCHNLDWLCYCFIFCTIAADVSMHDICERRNTNKNGITTMQVIVHILWTKQIATILQTTFSNGCSLIKTYEFWLKFYWSLFLGVQLTHWCRARWPPLLQTTIFQVHFLEWKLLNFKWNFTETFSLGSNWQYGSIGSDNGLAPNRRQTIIWSNVGMLHWRIYAHSASMS